MTPASGTRIKMTGNPVSAFRAAASGIQAPAAKLVPVTLYQQISASRTPGAASFTVMDVARVDIVQSLVTGDPPRAGQGRRRRRRGIQHLPVRVKGREMQRHLGSEVVEYPLGEAIELLVRIVCPRDHQCRDLHPHVRVVNQVLERIQYGLEMTTGQAMVEILRESLEVHIGGVHVGEEVLACTGRDVPGGHCNWQRFPPASPAKIVFPPRATC